MITLRLVSRPSYPVPQCEPEPPLLVQANLCRAYFPLRGIPFSLLIHGMVFCVLIFLRVSHHIVQPPRPPQETVIIHRNEPRVVMYLPLLQGGNPGMMFPARKENTRPKEPSTAAAPGIKGLSYPGPQPIVSNPPNPTNTIQTLLQPALKNPPILAPPLSLPNLVQIADTGTVPKSEPPSPTVSAPAEVKPAEPPPAKPPEVKPTKMFLPPVPTDVQPEVTISETILPPLKVVPPTIDIPKLVLPPLVPPPPEPKPPEPKPPEPKPPEPKPAEPPAKKEPLEPAAKPVPDRKPLPPKESKPPEAARAPVEPPKAEPAPKAAEKPKEPPAPDLPSASSRGTDPQDVLALTPMPAPIQQPLKIPPGEARGRFAISPEPNLTASGTEPGWKIETIPAAVGVGNRGGAAAENGTSRDATATAIVTVGAGSTKTKSKETAGGGAGSETASKPKAGSAPGAGAAGAGAAGTGAGSGTGSGPAKKPFSGITIAGGSYDPGIAAANPVTVVQAPPRPLQTAYGLTVISTENSGGGLPFFGVFSHEQIYTVYLDMRRTQFDPAPSWTLEFAVLPDPANPTGASRNPGKSQEGLVLPFPIAKEPPALPAELVRKYAGRMIIVYAVINIEGKMEQASVKDSPDALLNERALSALSKWLFRPARLNGEPVAVKALLGIPLSLPE